MKKIVLLTVLTAGLAGAGAAQAGNVGHPYRDHATGGEEIVVIDRYPGPVDPMARGALYNTPPAASFAVSHYGRYRPHRAVLRSRY